MSSNASSKNKLTQQHIKAMHLKQIYLSVLRAGELSRAELKREIELSFPSISALVDELISAGILIESDSPSKLERGRPRIMLSISPNAFFIPIVTLTRNGYRYALHNSCAELIDEGFLPFDDATAPADTEFWHPTTEALLIPIKNWLDSIPKDMNVLDLVFCLAGNLNDDNRLSSSSLRLTTDYDFFDAIAMATSKRLIFMNNSDCSAYAEKLFSDFTDDFVYIFIGKGVGAGIIRNGKVFGEGVDVRAGEIGHASIDYNGRFCECGNRGCLERYISTNVIASEARELIGVDDFEQVCAEYRRGNKGIISLIDEKARLLTVGICNMLTLQPVTHIVLGGGIEALGEGFLDAIHKHLKNIGLRRYSERVTVTFTKNPGQNEWLGALWNYLEHKMKIEFLI